MSENKTPLEEFTSWMEAQLGSLRWELHNEGALIFARKLKEIIINGQGSGKFPDPELQEIADFIERARELGMGKRVYENPTADFDIGL